MAGEARVGYAHARLLHAQCFWRNDGDSYPHTAAGMHWFLENDAFLNRLFLLATKERYAR